MGAAPYRKGQVLHSVFAAANFVVEAFEHEDYARRFAGSLG